MISKKSGLFSLFNSIITILTLIVCSCSDGKSDSGKDPADTTPPILLSVTINNLAPDSIVLKFDEAVEVDNSKGFSVDAASDRALVPMDIAVTGSGTQAIVLALSRIITADETATLSYDGTGNVRDKSANKLESFSNVYIAADRTSPAFGSARIDVDATDEVIATFSEPLVLSNDTGFTITTTGSGASAIDITGVAGSGTSTITFSLDTSLDDSLTVYIQYNILLGGDARDLSGNTLKSFGPEIVTFGSADSTPPEADYAVIFDSDPDVLLIQFSEDITNVTEDGFTIYINSGHVHPYDYSVVADDLIALWFTPPAAAGDDVTFSYSSSTGTIADLSGNDLGTISNMDVDNFITDETTPPELIFASVEDSARDEIAAEFSEEINVLDASGFDIMVLGSGTGASIINTSTGSGSDIIFYLDTEIGAGDTVILSYDGSGSIIDSDGNELEPFGSFVVDNNVGVVYYTIETFPNGGGSGADTYIYLYDSGYNPLESDDDSGDTMWYSKIEYPLVSGETYYIQVSDQYDSGNCYSILVNSGGGGSSSATPATDAGEPDNDFASAKTLTFGTTLNRCFSPTGESDFFVITMP